MKTRTLYLGGALVIAGLGAWVLGSIFADESTHPQAIRGAQASGSTGPERFAAKRGERAATHEGDEDAAEPERAQDDATLPEVDAPEPAAAAVAEPPPCLLSGTVVDPRGLPVVGAKVRLVSGNRRRRNRSVDVTTDGVGRFQAEVRAGGVWIRVQADGFVPEQEGTEVRAGVPHDVGEIRLARGAQLRGRVTDGAGRPLPQARVRARGPGRGARHDARSDVDGRFSIQVREGVYRLSGEAPGYVATELDGVAVTEEAGAEVALVLQRGGTLRGTVWSPDGKPVPSAQVFAYRDGERLGADAADEQGRFAIDGIEPGPLELFARSEDRALSCRVPIQISAQEQVQDVVLHEAAKIAGQLRTPDGTPLAGVRVRAVEVRGDVRRRSQTDDDGRFAIENLYPGVYRLEVVRQGRRPTSPEGAEAVEVIRGVVERDLVIARGARIAGEVRDASGRPVEGAGVFAIRDGDYLGTTRTDEAGAFEIEDLPGGTYRLFVRGDSDGLVSLSTLEVAPEATLEGLSLVARPPAKLRGRVVGPSGEGLSGVVLEVRGVDSPVERRARTQPDGSFELGPLYDGDYVGELSGDALKLLEAKLGREVQAPEVALSIVNGRDAEQVWVVR